MSDIADGIVGIGSIAGMGYSSYLLASGHPLAGALGMAGSVFSFVAADTGFFTSAFTMSWTGGLLIGGAVLGGILAGILGHSSNQKANQAEQALGSFNQKVNTLGSGSGIIGPTSGSPSAPSPLARLAAAPPPSSLSIISPDSQGGYSSSPVNVGGSMAITGQSSPDHAYRAILTPAPGGTLVPNPEAVAGMANQRRLAEAAGRTSGGTAAGFVTAGAGMDKSVQVGE